MRTSRIGFLRLVDLRRALAGLIFTLLTLAAPMTLSAQTLRDTTTLNDWGISSIVSVRLGELSLFREPAGDWLALRRLSTQGVSTSPSAPVSRPPVMRGSVAWVAELTGEQTNRLGGGFNIFTGSPSSGLLRYVSRDPEGNRLRFEYDRGETGFCGFWIQLYDADLPKSKRIYCDTEEISTLLVWVKGDLGGERITVRLADCEREEKEFSLPAGLLGEFTPAGKITREWQCARIPLKWFPKELKRSELALLVFQADAPEHSAIELREVVFTTDPEIPHPLLASRETGGASPRQEKGIWVWNTDTLLAESGAADRFLTFLGLEKYTTVFLAIPYKSGAFRTDSSIALPVAALRPLLKRLHGMGIRTEALFGDRAFAERKYHSYQLNSIRNVLRYNDSVRTEERFTGIHLDVEPYLLPGFMGARKDAMAGEYIELLEKCKALCVTGGIRLAADIPFWYDTPDEITGEKLFGAKGVHPDLLERILDHVDLLVVMDYRTQTFGVDGILRQTEGELLKGEARKRKVMIGLESTPLPVEELWIFQGEPTQRPEGDKAYAALREVRGMVEGRFIPRTDEEAEESRLVAGESWHYWPATRLATVPPEKLSFWSLGGKALKRSMEEALPFLATSAAFHGFALHHYGSLKSLK